MDALSALRDGRGWGCVSGVDELIIARVLQGVKEGVLALDDAGRVTLVNDEAPALLGLPADAEGPDRAGGAAVRARQHPRRHEHPARPGPRVRQPAACLGGLIELADHDEAARYVRSIRQGRQMVDSTVTGLIGDPAVAALLLARLSVAAERRVSLRLPEVSRLQPVDDRLTSDLVTVVGNLVDNALDAVAGSPLAEVTVAVVQEPGCVTVTVHDSGPGFRTSCATRSSRRASAPRAGSACAATAWA
ncbi:MAG: hypothetical protein M3P91_00520 [Actinomycetota bacterium]|nr:hypothetical protein [Actinomycetota bacterium]